MELLSQADGLYRFRIKNFSFHKNNFEGAEISPFRECFSRWKISFKHFFQNGENHVLLELQKVDSGSHSSDMDIMYSFLASDGTTLSTKTSAKVKISSIDPKIILKGPKHSFLKEKVKADDILIILIYFDLLSSCCCKGLKDKSTFEEQLFKINSLSSQNCLTQLQHDLSSIVCNEQLSDVLLKVGEDSIPAHKCILIARSPVLKKMFEDNFKESFSNVIEIEDFDKKTLKLFLKYIYTGVLIDCDFDCIISLYQLSDKYDVQCLYQMCRKILIENLSKFNACALLNLSNCHNDDTMKKSVIDFIGEDFFNT